MAALPEKTNMKGFPCMEVRCDRNAPSQERSQKVTSCLTPRRSIPVAKESNAYREDFNTYSTKQEPS